MKVRLRFRKNTKVLSIEEEHEDQFSILDIRNSTLNLFDGSLPDEIKLSLNKIDVLDDETKTLLDCGIVSGDLIYIITSDGEVNTSASSSSSDLLTHENHYQRTPSVGSENRMSESNTSMATDGTPPDQPDQDQHPGVDAVTTNNPDSPQSGSTHDCDTTGAGVMDCEPDEPVNMVVVNSCLSEPTLCREATEGRVPAMLMEVYVAAEPSDAVEAVCVALHVLMLETGYSIYPEPSTSSTLLPDMWKYQGFYKFTYTYPSCQDAACSVTIVTVGTSVMVHGKVLGDASDTRQCVIKPETFVQTLAHDADCSQCYSGLAKLSRIFKDSIAHPLVHDIRVASGMEDVFGLLALTQEIKLQILSSLSVRHLLRMSLVNAEFSSLCRDPYIWRRLYLKDFGNRRYNSLSQDWRALYIREYKVRKERRKLMSRMTLITPPTFGPGNPFAGPSHWIPPGPGMIGGDYDLFPSGLPGAPSGFGPLPTNLPRPRYDLIGPHPDLDPSPDPTLLPRRPVINRRGGGRNPFGYFGPRFF